MGSPATALDRAYSLLHVKSIDEELRVLRGIATTPTLDRGGDIVDPLGVRFKNPLPFCLHHKKELPVGQVTFSPPTKDGIAFEARIPHVLEPGIVKDRTDEAWHSAKYGLLRGVSIGYLPLKASPIQGGRFHLKEMEVIELSMVTVPMNAETTITAIKSLDETYRAASGQTVDTSAPQTSAGVTAPVRLAPRSAVAMTPQERISLVEKNITDKKTAMEGIQTKVDAENRGKDASEREQFDTLMGEVDSLLAELSDAKRMEELSVKSATRVEVKAAPESLTRLRGGDSSPVVALKPNLEKGTLFTRYAMAIAAGKGSMSDAMMFARERWGSQTPEVEKFIQDAPRYSKAVEGTTTGASPGWGAELVYAQNLVGEFIDLLRAREIISRLNGIRRVPFNVRIPSMTGGATVGWVAEAAAKPVTQPDFGTVSVGYHKMAGIVVLTDELVKLSQPNAEEAVRRDLVEQIVRFMDRQFLDPAVTATAAGPASITNGVSAPNASGTDADAVYTDLNTALATFDAAEVGTDTVHVLMPPSVARAIASLRNALGQFEFVGAGGGMLNTLLGFPVIISSSVPSATMILVKADEILLADDGRVDLDASNQATLDMAGGNSPTFSLYQKNCIAIRAERGVSWAKRRAASVAVIDTIAYAP